MNKTSIKIITSLFFVLSGLYLVQSCTDEIPRVLEGTVLSLETKSLNLSANSVHFDSYEKSSMSVTVRAENMEWEFTDIPEWISITPTSGVGETDVRIEVSENPNAVNRVGMLTFRSVGSAWNYSMTFTVSQFRAPYSISLPVDTLQVLSESTTRTVQVDTNTDTWTIVVPESMNWCTARKAEGGMVITVDENKSAYSRKGIIELHTDDVSAYLTVTQHPSGVKTVNDGVGFSVEGGSQSMGVNISASWSIENTNSWIVVKTLSGDAGFADLPIEVTPNYDLKTRDGFIYIVIAQDNKIAVPVHQEGISFSVDKSISVPSIDYTTRLNIKSNMPWRFCVDSIPDWITVDPASGSGNTQVLVKIKSNRVMRIRTASLPIDIVSQDGSSVLGHTSVEVSQEAFTFGADAAALYFSDVAGNTMFNIKSDGNWFAHSLASWITVSPDEGDKSSPVNVSVTENMDSTARFGSVILRTSGRRDTVPVYQAGKFIDVSSKALNFSSNRDSVAVNLKANGHWTASPSASWIKLSESEGDGDCDVTITVQDNPFASSRLGEVTVSRGGSNPIRISVSQAGRYLTISSNNIVFFEKGGISEPITVQTDGKYTLQTETDWITINKETESQFTITASQNAGTDSRTGYVYVYLTDLTSGTLQRSIKVIQGTHFEAEYVDLGLSVCWATCNVGATDPYEYGGIYAWGELTVKSSYGGWSTYKYSNGTVSTLTKYNSFSEYGNGGYVDNKVTLEPLDDVASVMWGEDWRIPTRGEYDELVNNCSWEWTTMNGVNGYLVTSCVPGYTDRSIFLPGAGGIWNINKGNVGQGFYWSSEVSLNPSKTCNLNFTSTKYAIGEERRYVGFSVRAVRPSPKSENISLDLSRSVLCIEENREEPLIAIVKQNYEVVDALVTFSSSNNNVASVDDEGVIRAISPGTCTITVESGTAKAECRVHVTTSSVMPQMVDLGLSVKWATFNVGADSPEQAGYYFAWGETESKSSYNQVSYKHSVGLSSSSQTITKYCYSTDWGIRDDRLILEPEDDAATALWGNEWRTPTPKEMDELIENCTWVWTNQNGVDGYKVTSNVNGFTDRSIFLPVTGACGIDRQMGMEQFGHYWTSSIEDAGWAAAWKLLFNEGSVKFITDNRFYGYTIRAVSNTPIAVPEPVDLGLSVFWASFNLGASDPKEYGDYLSWGEINGKGYYSTNSYRYNKEQYIKMTQGDNISGTEYDAAHVRLGGNWRMPTKEECEELVNKCTWSWEQYEEGKYGMKVTGPNGNSIFLPAGGYPNPSWMNVGTYGTYWTSSKSTYMSDTYMGQNYSYYFRFDQSMHEVTDYQGATYVGQLLRPVCSSSTDTPVIATGYENGYGYVNLGLSVKWATNNVGAENLEDGGDYYAWGEIEPKTEYSWSSYDFCVDSESTLTKYCNSTSSGYNSYVDYKTVLDDDNDIARVKWGGSWRMPTKSEQDELLNNCTWTSTTVKGVYGYLVTSNIPGYTGRSIFLPAAGYWEDTSTQYVGSCGRYWSSSLDSDDPSRATRLAFGTPNVNWHSGRRFVGFSVRPVCQ